MLWVITVMNLMLRWGDKYMRPKLPIRNPDMGVTEIRPQHIKREHDDRYAANEQR